MPWGTADFLLWEKAEQLSGEKGSSGARLADYDW
jgi:hypothetical protein